MGRFYISHTRDLRSHLDPNLCGSASGIMVDPADFLSQLGAYRTWSFDADISLLNLGEEREEGKRGQLSNNLQIVPST